MLGSGVHPGLLYAGALLSTMTTTASLDSTTPTSGGWALEDIAWDPVAVVRAHAPAQPLWSRTDGPAARAGGVTRPQPGVDRFGGGLAAAGSRVWRACRGAECATRTPGGRARVGLPNRGV